MSAILVVVIVMCVLGVALIASGMWLLMHRRYRLNEPPTTDDSTEAKIPGIDLAVKLPPPALLLGAGTVLLIAGGSLAAHTAASGAPVTPVPTTAPARNTPSSSVPADESPSPTTPHLQITLTCDLSTKAPMPGMTVQMTYHITSSQQRSVGLGASLYDSQGNDLSTGDGDIDSFLLSAGQTTDSRPLPLPKNIPAGRYEIDAEIWPPNEIGKNGVNTLKDAFCANLVVP
jgi:hypothetical protein